MKTTEQKLAHKIRTGYQQYQVGRSRFYIEVWVGENVIRLEDCSGRSHQSRFRLCVNGTNNTLTPIIGKVDALFRILTGLTVEECIKISDKLAANKRRKLIREYGLEYVQMCEDADRDCLANYE